ncbi:MAG: DUF58 domain-containing protein [Myxococcota bacterium]
MTIPSGRALALWGLATLLFVFAFVTPWLAVAGLVADLAIAACTWVDGRGAARRAIRVRRRLPEVVCQGERAALAWDVDNLDAFPLRLRLRDVLELGDTAVEAELVAPAGARVTHRAEVVPKRRGRSPLPPIALRVAGRWGLAWSPREVPGEDAVRVHPRLHPDGDDALALRRALAVRPGQHDLARPGLSTEFHALRDYQRGDDFRRIHWKATARARRPVTVETTWEQEQEIVVLVDCGRPMAASSGPWSKLDHALSAALALARAAGAWRDVVTIVLFSREVRCAVRVDGRAGGFARALEALLEQHADEEEPDYAAAAGWCMRKVPRRSLAFLFTSVGDALAADAIAEATVALARRHRPVLVNLDDPGVAALARAIPTDVAGAYAKVSALAVDEANEGLYARLRQKKVEVVPAPADRLTVGVLQAFLDLKSRG